MFVVPVIDLLHGVVVRGVAGRRDEYRPIVSGLVEGSSPRAIASVFRERFGFDTVYVADLDAIGGRESNWNAYREITAKGLSLWLDAGIRSAHCASRLTDALSEWGANARFIVGLESVASIRDLADTLVVLAADQTIFSLDLRQGRPITHIDPWRDSPPATIVGEVVALGVQRLIVLDLADVGVGRGTGTLELVRQLQKDHPTLQIIAGGGVRGVDDLRRLAEAGCDAALVASALHDGILTPEDLRSYLP